MLEALNRMLGTELPGAQYNVVNGNVRIYPEPGIATAFLANHTELSPGPIDRRSDALDAAFLA